MRVKYVALFFIATAFCVPSSIRAATIWRSAPTHPDEVRLYTPNPTMPWYGETSTSTLIQIGTWNQPNFTTDASTTVHIWARWNEVVSPTLDVFMATADPIIDSGTPNIIRDPDNNSYYYRLNVLATSTLQEYILPTMPGQVIGIGDEVNFWVDLYPSWLGYGANHWIGSNGTLPYVEVCEGACDGDNSTSTTTPPAATSTESFSSNILFLPGIEGSRLYEGIGCGKTTEEKLWEPFDSVWKALFGAGDEKVKNLFLDQSGGSVCSDIYTKENDIIDSVGGSNIYKSFIDEMNGLKADGTIADWKPVAYDWRLSLDDLLNNGEERDGKIYYEESTSTPYILQTLRSLAASSETGKVTIIAHSNGGLVAKALLNQLGTETAKSLVDKVIMIGVPQSGAPVDVGALLYGLGQGISSWGIPILHSSVAQDLAENSPMAYHLLPSENYLNSIASDTNHPVARFTGDAYATEISTYGTTITNQAALDDFLLASTTLNSLLINYANSQHATLDSWVPPEGIEIDQIAGWGVDTVAGIDFYTPQLADALTALEPQHAYRPIFTEDGDGTVTIPSALMMASSTNVNRYWVDLGKINNLPGAPIKYDHKDLFEIPSLQDFIKNIIENSTSTLPTYISTTQPPTNVASKKLTFFLHSPLTLQLTDSSGNITGLAQDDSITENIPDSTYGEFGDVKYITVPVGDNYQLTMHGQANGTFSLDIQEMSGDVVTNSSTIANVPTTASTLASLTISGGLDTASPLDVDENGDGTNVITIAPVLGEIVNYQPPTPASTNPPESSVSAAAPQTISPQGGIPAIAQVPTPTTTNTISTTTQPIATSTLATIAHTKSLQTKKKPQIAITPAGKVNTNIPQTASVYEASQQSFLKNIGTRVYNSLYGFWSAIKKLF